MLSPVGHTYTRRRWRRSFGETNLPRKAREEGKVELNDATAIQVVLVVRAPPGMYIRTYVGPGLNNGPLVDVSVLPISWVRMRTRIHDRGYLGVYVHAMQVRYQMILPHSISCLPSKAPPV